MEVRVERRRNAGEVRKPERMLVDAWAVVEVRSGLVLRWLLNENEANRAAERVRNGGLV